MADRRNGSTGSPYEPIIGISRAVRIGNIIAVAGTAPLGPDGKTIGVGDPATQARRCFEISKLAIEKLGADLSSVIRTRIMGCCSTTPSDGGVGCRLGRRRDTLDRSYRKDRA